MNSAPVSPTNKLPCSGLNISRRKISPSTETEPASGVAQNMCSLFFLSSTASASRVTAGVSKWIGSSPE